MHVGVMRLVLEIPGARLLVHEEMPADVVRAVLSFLGTA